MIGKIVCYSAMTLRATDFGLTELACHNIMMRIFFFYATFGDSLSQASQTFLPRVLTKNKSKTTTTTTTTINGSTTTSTTNNNNNKNGGLIQLTRRLAILSAAVGLLDWNVSNFVVHRFGTYFTKEASILALMKKHSFFMALSLLLHPFIMLFEGAIIATRDLTFLVGTYAVTMGLLFGQLRYGTNSFAGVWRALFCFQALRTVQFGYRFVSKTLRGGQNKKNNQEEDEKKKKKEINGIRVNGASPNGA